MPTVFKPAEFSVLAGSPNLATSPGVTGRAISRAFSGAAAPCAARVAVSARSTAPRRSAVFGLFNMFAFIVASFCLSLIVVAF